MDDFNGEIGSSKVNLGGRGRGRESKSDFLKRQHRERDAREKKRVQNKSATKIQSIFRRHRCLKTVRAAHRQTFDKNRLHIQKVGGILAADKQAKFIFHSIMPMLRLFTFFFIRAEDDERLAAMSELFLTCAKQQPPSNAIHLAFADETRVSFLVLFEKLLTALLHSGRIGDVALHVHAVQAVLFAGPEFQPVDPIKSTAIVRHLMFHTEVVKLLTSKWFHKSLGTSAGKQATELLMFFFFGLQACSTQECQRQLVCLLSVPRLGEALCEGNVERSSCQACLQRLAADLTDPPSPGALTDLINEPVEGIVRGVWAFNNVVTIFQQFLLVNDAVKKNLAVWLGWLCWLKSAVVEDGLLNKDVYKPSFVRRLLNVMDRQNSAELLAVCQFYFSASDSSGSCEPPVEVIQTLAFATPLAEKLFQTLAHLMRQPWIDTVFAALGAPTFETAEATRLRVFCAVYALQLQPMYDYEFFGTANPLRKEEVELLVPFLNKLTYHFVTRFPERSSLTPAGKALRSGLTCLLSLLYNRHRRRPILRDDAAWIIPDSRLLFHHASVVDLGDDQPAGSGAASPDDESIVVEEDRMDVDVSQSTASAPAGLGSVANGSHRAGTRAAEKVLEAVLEEIPHVLPFGDRVALLHKVILNDQEQRRDTRAPWAQSAIQRHQIRRNFLVEDGFAAFDSLSNVELKDIFRVEFIAPDGSPESGVDGGGLFKEFMVHICRTMFDPEFGLFAATSDQTLYPSVSAFRVHEEAVKLYVFLGKVVGKAIYEMFLLEPQFSRVFLNRLLGRLNEVDDVAALDRELHRNMLRIKESNNIEELDLYFSVSYSDAGYYEEIDLIPDGRNVPVTSDNLTRYFHLMANYKTNVQFRRQTEAFLRGIQCVLPLAWLKMFDPYELNILISGSPQGFDVEDLKRNSVCSGGYQEDSPVVQWLWKLLQHHMKPEDMGRFLMFVTSCSRAPLLGFKTLYPKFCIHRVPSGQLLPTASTCANLLKLPDYASYEVLRTKLLQAITAEAGFDLS